MRDLTVPKGMNAVLQFRLVVFLTLALACSNLVGQNTPSTQKSAAPAPDATAIQAARSRILLNASDEGAWLDLYKSVREENASSRYRTLSEAKKNELQGVLSEMERHIRGTYSWNLARYIHFEKSDAGWNYLREAAAMRPVALELYPEMVCMHTIHGEQKQANEFARKMWEANYFSQQIIDYNRNVLQSIEKNGILITHGFADTYPIHALQAGKGVRKDVTLICLEWTGSATYLKQISQATGADLIGLEGKPYAILSRLLSTRDQNIYCSLTIPPDELRPWSEQLFCTGLAMKFSKVPLNNIDQLRDNWENRFSKTSITKSEALNRNYVIPLSLLYSYYKSSGKTAAMKEVREMALELGLQHGIQNAIEPYFR